ncbi:TetR/AcrR family transcriptional regulator [Nocardioides limicola]|uniref:TetR/AcrR family transcriptional regulator n=1 Tax=Nocardioides limicola TaxID=2803368 RepID=UPI00193C7EF4|nr:TetR/AcrR family transcriptional regulator C-terminal domain-containing protein [Nocardioides sp. DJM-14]
MSTASERQSPRGVGRPRETVLSRDRIVAAGLTLLDEVGPEGFSMAALAARMSVRPSSFYNHVSGKEDVLDGIQELITDSIDASMFDERPWTEAVTAWARGYRAAFIAHPRAITLFATMPVKGAIRTLHMYEHVVLGFRRAGWPEERIIPAMVALESFILGSALDATAPTDVLSPGAAAEAVPDFAAAVAAHDEALQRTGGSPADAAFEEGLTALVTGLSASLQGGDGLTD